MAWGYRHGQGSEMTPILRISALRITREALCVLALASCTTFACRPVTVTVANKKESARLETVPGAMRTTETGRLEPDLRQQRIAREYWVQGQDGAWYRVAAEQFSAAEVGRALEICN